jgi:hypothetical protein
MCMYVQVVLLANRVRTVRHAFDVDTTIILGWRWVVSGIPLKRRVGSAISVPVTSIYFGWCPSSCPSPFRSPFLVDLAPAARVRELRRLATARFPHLELLKVLYSGSILEDDRTIASYDVQKEATVQVSFPSIHSFVPRVVFT